MSQGFHGVVLLDKPSGESSFQTLGAVKRRLGIRRVGHAGTLDPFATGLLVALCGCCTRMASVVESMDKEYEARMVFGLKTDTLDPEGSVVERGTVPAVEEVVRALEAFRGEIEQQPPAFSAVHVAGRRAYDVARRGGKVELGARRVAVHELELLEFAPPHLRFRLRCGRGTYVRALARDLATSLGTCGSLVELRRVRVGCFHVESAVAPQGFEPERDLMRPAELARRYGVPAMATLRAEYVERVRHGAPLEDRFFDVAPPEGAIAAVYGDAEGLVALVERREGCYRYRAVLSQY